MFSGRGQMILIVGAARAVVRNRAWVISNDRERIVLGFVCAQSISK